MDLEVGDRGLEFSFTESYVVLSDSKLATFVAVMDGAVAIEQSVIDLLGFVNGAQSNTLPFPNLTVHRDGISVCKSLGGEQDSENPLKWKFTAQWSTRVSEGLNSANGTTFDPATAIPVRETLHELVSRARNKDLIGRAYVNGAGNLYNPTLTVEEELPRWDFTQIDRSYVGPIGNYSTTYNGLSTSGTSKLSILTKYDTTSVPGKIYPPGVYIQSNGWQLFGPTDATMFYLNGCVNSVPFLGFDAYTLLLKVRSSKIVKYFGSQHRVTEYSIVYDEQNHWDKPINAGPFFYGPKLDDAGDIEQNEPFISYPYIYYSADEENVDTDLSQEDAGPLGYRDMTLTYNETTGKMEPPEHSRFDGMPTGTGPAFSGLDPGGNPIPDYDKAIKKVKLPSGKFTYRAVKSTVSQDLYHIEYVNHNLISFGDVLRIQ